MPIDNAFHQAIEDKIFSGAQVILGKGASTLFSKSYGRVNQEPDSQPVTEKTLFDIASLTKPVSTATLYLQALGQLKISLDDSIQKYLPTFVRQETLSLRQLLTHTSGLPAWLPLFQNVNSADKLQTIKENFIQQICLSPLEAKPGERRIYSDLGYILLGFALEKIFQASLRELFTQSVTEPLNLKSTQFNPTQTEAAIAATGFSSWRGRVLQGEVDDDNAFALGGVAGHAGLFSTASDLEKFLQNILLDRKPEWISKKLFDELVGGTILFKLGWDTVSPSNSQAGSFFSASTIGHLGFTGCSFWLDRQDGKYIILLTNRVHPSRDNDRIKQFRPSIHDLLLKEVRLS